MLTTYQLCEISKVRLMNPNFFVWTLLLCFLLILSCNTDLKVEKISRFDENYGHSSLNAVALNNGREVIIDSYGLELYDELKLNGKKYFLFKHSNCWECDGDWELHMTDLKSDTLDFFESSVSTILPILRFLSHEATHLSRAIQVYKKFRPSSVDMDYLQIIEQNDFEEVISNAYDFNEKGYEMFYDELTSDFERGKNDEYFKIVERQSYYGEVLPDQFGLIQFFTCNRYGKGKDYCDTHLFTEFIYIDNDGDLKKDFFEFHYRKDDVISRFIKGKCREWEKEEVFLEKGGYYRDDSLDEIYRYSEY
jgi:hypothetical protein